jgi:hypothetical protein
MIRFLLLIACLAVSNTLYASIDSCTDHQCIAVVDAGSTGSRMHVYAYDLDKTNSPININELWSKKVKPGFATIDNNQSTVDAYLSSLFSGAPVHSMPVYFYATAGMRLLPQTKQKVYYQELQQWFARQSDWQLAEGKTITGTEEALFDWLSVNYHLGTLQSVTNQSIGVIDIGGASAQIVFPVQKNSDHHEGSQIGIDLYGQHFNLFARSFLGLGQNEMSHQFLNSASCFAINYPLPDGKAGQGNAAACSQEISALINGVHGVNNAVQPTLAANPVNSWYAIGGIVNLATSKPFHFQNNQLNNQDFLQQADNSVCHEQWESLSNQFPNDEFIGSYCLLPAYYSALMVDGFGFTAEQAVNYFAPDQNLDWAKGVVLHHPGKTSCE